jgi:hypothetical protein
LIKTGRRLANVCEGTSRKHVTKNVVVEALVYPQK